MNERLKFRVWDKEEKTYTVLPYGSFALSESGELFWIESNCDCSELNTEDYIIEQCTGLRDKNGKLIYEGDILLVANVMGEFKVCVEHCDEEASYYCRDYDGDTLTILVAYADKSKVIGNIHQNPELLK